MKKLDLLEVVEALKNGKCIYVGYCINVDINDVEMMFDSDDEAVNFYTKYRAEVYKYYKENGNFKKDLIYKPQNEDIVTVVVYGKIYKEPREKLMKEFLNGMYACEGSEKERYTDIYLDLKSGYVYIDNDKGDRH